jgi:CMP-N-acetylneuraminic acid synthetase/spore coat polysaccharide biosynthesis predicted glycosyltransferase SpsG
VWPAVFVGVVFARAVGAVLAIVPARGGSKSIPRKNLRAVNGRPLILHTLGTLSDVPRFHRIIVSTDDQEIAGVARSHGYEVVDRPPEHATDTATIADVAEHVVAALGWNGAVGVFQPTSPTLKAETVREAISVFDHGHYASLCSVVADTKLRWNDYGPLYNSRVNRQQLSPEWRETGGIQLARTGYQLVGDPHRLFEVPADEAHDIDTIDDLEAARRALSRKRIEFRLVAGEKVGAGHLYRCLALADELAHHMVRFGECHGWVKNIIQGRGYPIGGWADPDLVVFDTLDTTVQEVAATKARGAHVVTLEDLGSGARLADLTINELYSTGDECGPRWAVLRPEFLALPPVPIREHARKILVLFGGTDPAHLSERVSAVCGREGSTTVLLGPGANPGAFHPGIDVLRGASVAELIRQHDLVVTSAGRTVHEAAACGVPVVSIAANERESRHSHCPGVLRMGLHVALSDDAIQEAVHRLLKAPDLRAEMAGTARAAVDGLGARRFAHRVEGLLEGL